MDEVGIDVGAKVTAIMKEYYSEHMDFPAQATIDLLKRSDRARRTRILPLQAGRSV